MVRRQAKNIENNLQLHHSRNANQMKKTPRSTLSIGIVSLVHCEHVLHVERASEEKKESERETEFYLHHHQRNRIEIHLHLLCAQSLHILFNRNGSRGKVLHSFV